jgi:hypothetical protein
MVAGAAGVGTAVERSARMGVARVLIRIIAGTTVPSRILVLRCGETVDRVSRYGEFVERARPATLVAQGSATSAYEARSTVHA